MEDSAQIGFELNLNKGEVFLFGGTYEERSKAMDDLRTIDDN